MADHKPTLRHEEPRPGWRYRWLASNGCPEVDLIVTRVTKRTVTMDDTAGAFTIKFCDKARALSSGGLVKYFP